MAEDGAELGQFVFADEVGLVDDDDIGEFDLVDEEVGDGAFVAFAGGHVAVLEVIGGVELFEEVGRVDDRDHGVEAGDVLQSVAFLVGEGEGLRDGERFGNAGRFDEQVIEASFAGEARDFLEQVVTQGAANAAVGHLDEFLLGAAEFGAAVADEFGVDVDLAHVIDDDRDAPAFAVVEDVVEEGGFSGAEEAGEDGDGKFHE